MEIFLPRNFEDADIVKFLNELEQYKDEENICTNYSKVEFVKPYATLLLAVGMRDFLRYRFNKGLKTTSKGQKENRTALTYLQHLGFFQYIGLNLGKKPNEASGSSTYIPITQLSAEQFDIEGKRLQEVIDTESDRLAKIIYPGEENVMRAIMLSYCLREIIRNVFEHAEVNECFVLAQSWRNGIAEIAIADRGIGLYESLKEAHALKNQQDAVKIALQPGITSDTGPDNDDKWQNSGFGLYVVSELGLMLGDFAIASNGKIMFSDHGVISWFDVPIRGVAVKLRMDTNEAEYWPNVLNNIVEKGEEIAKTIPGSKRKASKMSKMRDDVW